MPYLPASDEAQYPRLDLSPGNADAAVAPTFQLRDMLGILSRRKLLVLSLAVCGLLAGVLVNRFSQRMFTSTVTVEVNQENSTGVGLNDLSGLANQSGGSEELPTTLATQEAIIQGGSVALKVIQDLNLTANRPYSISTDPKTLRSPLGRERGLPLEEAPLQRERVLGIFHSRLKVGLVKDTTLLTVSFSDQNPALAARVANEVIGAYTLQYAQARYAASSRAFLGLQSQLSDLKDEVNDSERKVSDFEQQTGLVSTAPAAGSSGTAGTPGTDEVSMNRFLELNQELTAAQVSRIASEAVYRMTQAHDPDLVLGATSARLASNAGKGSALAPDSADLALLASLREQKSKLALQQATEAATYGARNPTLIGLQNQTNELNAQIERELERIQARAKSDFDLALLNEEKLGAQVALQQQEVTKVGNSANQLMLLEQEQASSRQLYQDLYTKLEEARVAAALRSSNVTIVDPARISTVPSTPLTQRNLILGILLGGSLGVFLAFLLDLLDDSLSSVEQVGRLTSLPVIASIPQVHAPNNRRLTSLAGDSRELRTVPPVLTVKTPFANAAWLLKAPNSPEAEAIRSLRGGLLFGGVQGARSILFASPASGDGKSTICFNLAVALALQGRQVLLIDADMRHPKLQRLTGASNELGLRQYLPGRMPLRDVVQPCIGIKNLFILPSGGTSVAPAELLGMSRFAELLRNGTAEYHHVLIDSPAMLSVTDALVISALADRTLLIVRSRKTMRDTLRRALANPLLNGSRLQLVLNGVDMRSPDVYLGAAYEPETAAT